MMTPEEAAQRRDRLIDLGYLVETPALRAYKTIAGMTYEYALQVRLEENGQWHQVAEWNADPNPYKPGHALKHNERLVRRLVSQPEEVQHAKEKQ